MTRIEQTIKTIRDVLLYILLFATAISYHPTIINMSRIAGYENGTILSRYIIMLFGAVFILSLNISILKKSRFTRNYVIWLSVIFVASLILVAFYRNRIMLHECRAFVIVLGSIMIGYDLRITRSQLVTIVLVFCLTTLFAGIMQVLVNNGGFRIANQYLTDSKNSLGAMLATGAFSLLYLYRFLNKRFSKNLTLVCFLLTLVVIVTIRARMALVAVALVLLLYYFLATRNRNVLITVLALGAISIIGIVFMPGFVLDYLDASFTAGSQGSDFTSGRLYTYGEAISYLIQNPLLGNVERLNQIGWIHNYPLLKVYDYGLLFSWPILVLYVIVGFHALFMARRYDSMSIVCFAGSCLLIPYLISMAEPTFPFGPGTVTMYNFLMIGIAENRIVKTKQ